MAGNALKLLAEDVKVSAIIAAAVQDSLVKPEDIKLDASLAHVRTGDQPVPVGTRGQAHAVLPVARSAGIRRRSIRPQPFAVSRDMDAVHALIDIRFAPAESAGRVITLMFAGETQIELKVECVDVTLAGYRAGMADAAQA
jgi:hypothetical protein